MFKIITNKSENSNESNQFASSRTTKFNKFVERSGFSTVPVSEAVSYFIYGARFVDQIKTVGISIACEMYRLVVQDYNDANHGL